ncbi:hypothetical protein EDC94DRAFT_656440 [Helicostylum pulchrum]|nr:hypothetical protein EDC94DRAFT_656440 [Helicostylum pulchrum]
MSTVIDLTMYVDDDQTKHIEELTQPLLKSTEGKGVLIDPGRRDIMYCMGETSNIEKKQRLVFTKNNRSNRSRQYRILRKTTLPLVVKEAEAALSKTKSKSVHLEKFKLHNY